MPFQKYLRQLEKNIVFEQLNPNYALMIWEELAAKEKHKYVLIIKVFK